jgi:hypothetical protein
MRWQLWSTRTSAKAVVLLSVGLWLSWAVYSGTAWPRDWKPDAKGLAQNYSVITDSRNPHDIRMVMWMSSPLVSPGAARDLLDSYVVVGVVRAHMLPGGTMSFDPITTLQALDGNGVALHLLKDDQMPPVLNGTIATLAAVFSRSFGAFGQGFHWFVFDTGGVGACKQGGLAIPFAGEVYTYRTPIPGCPSTIENG